MKKLIPTKFAAAERAEKKVLKQQSDIIAGQPQLVNVLNAVATAVLILNQERQIVFANKTFMDIIGVTNLAEVVGMRVGEAIGCVHAAEAEGGCGTTEFCRMCGAVNAVLSSLNGHKDVQECRIIVDEEPRALDLRVMATPLTVNGDEYSVFSVLDIADEKRKEVLERIFFHDLMNTVTGLQGFSRLLSSATEEALPEYFSTINYLSDKLVDEIDAQRQLSQAENNRLAVHAESVNTINVLRRVKEVYLKHEVARDRQIDVDAEAAGLMFDTDETLLMRVIGNMTKNALEAIKPGESVTLSCRKEGERVRFTVHNPGEMTEEARLQVFQRSFSTKGAGRGLGTYSVKLLTESYLMGKVGFNTSADEGITFFADYPVKLELD
jgi:signal transduction histidine kinase